jgi:hypothetical protein
MLDKRPVFIGMPFANDERVQIALRYMDFKGQHPCHRHSLKNQFLSNGEIMEKKHLILWAALTSALGVFNAHAEGLYTYALIDGGIASTRISGPNLPAVSSKSEFITGGYAPTFVGMTYEKAASGGLTVGGKLEQGFLISPANGSNSRYFFGNGELFNREANIYIKSAAGTFAMGTQPNFAFKTVLIGEPRSGSNFGSSLAMIDIKGGLPTVDDAAISYTSATFNGFSLAGQYVPETKSAKACDSCYNVKSGSRVSVSYAQEDIKFGLATYDSSVLTSTQAPSATIKSSGSIASGAYKMGVITLKGIFASQKNPDMGLSTTMKTTGLGGSYAVSGETTLDFGVYQSKAGALNVATTGAGAQHKLTKELTLYGQVAKVQNKSTDTSKGFINFAGPSVLTDDLLKGQTANTVNVGLLLALF